MGLFRHEKPGSMGEVLLSLSFFLVFHVVLENHESNSIGPSTTPKILATVPIIH